MTHSPIRPPILLQTLHLNSISHSDAIRTLLSVPAGAAGAAGRSWVKSFPWFLHVIPFASLVHAGATLSCPICLTFRSFILTLFHCIDPHLYPISVVGCLRNSLSVPTGAAGKSWADFIPWFLHAITFAALVHAGDDIIMSYRSHVSFLCCSLRPFPWRCSTFRTPLCNIRCSSRWVWVECCPQACTVFFF